MYNVNSLSVLDTKPVNPTSFWWIDRNLLRLPVHSTESLALSEPVVEKLQTSLADIIKKLTEKNDFIFSKVKDVFGYRLKLEQTFRTVQNSKVSWESLSEIEIYGFDLISCQNKLLNMQNQNVYIGTSLQRTPIETVDEMPNISDDDIVASIDSLELSVTVNKVKFFDKTTKKDVLKFVDDLTAFDKSFEAMVGYSPRVAADAKTYADPIKNLAKNSTVDVAEIHDVVDQINKKITTVNHLLNAMFLLQAYNKVLNVITTHAISNMKEQ